MRRCLDDGSSARGRCSESRDKADATAAVHVYNPASDSSILVMYRRRLSASERSTYTLHSKYQLLAMIR